MPFALAPLVITGGGGTPAPLNAMLVPPKVESQLTVKFPP
jgi:hypothetical protein